MSEKLPTIKPELSHEAEPNNEAQEKVVDIFEVENLKYRDQRIETIPSMLSGGIFTPLTEFLHEPLSQVDAGTRKKIRDRSGEREEERRQEEPERKGQRFANRANVYYPEGALQYLRGTYLDSHQVEVYSSVEEMEIRRLAVRELESVLGKLENNLEFQKVFAPFREKINEALSILTRSGYGPLRVEDVEEHRGLWDKAHDAKIGHSFQEFISDPKIWEFIRRECIKSFFDDGKKESGLWQDYGRNLGFGFVLAPETNVVLSYHDDYPSQATLWDPRLKPEKIIGFIINPDYKKEGKPPYFVPRDALSMLNKTRFEIPDDPFTYLKAWASRPFSLFLNENEVSESKVKEYYEIKSAELKDTIGTEEYQKLQELAKLFFEQNSPIKEGETLMTGLIRAAEQHQLPIYTTRGELLWPKNLNHGELEIFIKNRDQDKKE